MSIPPFDALEAGLRIGRALEREGIAYALGGALAVGVSDHVWSIAEIVALLDKPIDAGADDALVRVR